MSCLNPNLIRWVLDPTTGSLEHVFLGPARYTNPEDYGSFEALLKGEIKYFYQTVPCQQCASCRLDYSREWATRLCLELKSNPKALFVTLTYRDTDLHYTNTGLADLSVRDTQLFWKRLRREFPGTRIRFYLSGEYGARTCRPHYHAIIYGLDLSDFPDIIWRSNNYLRQPLYSSPKLEKIWSHGNVRIGLVTSRSCAYTARYVNKNNLEPMIEILAIGLHPLRLAHAVLVLACWKPLPWSPPAILNLLFRAVTRSLRLHFLVLLFATPKIMLTN